MTLEVINVGAAPNDGTGDVWRDAWIKVNNNFAQSFNGPYVIGPPTSGITLQVNQGTLESNSVPGIFVTGDVGFQAAIALGANGAVPGVGSFDIQQSFGGAGFLAVRPNAAMNFYTNNLGRMVINAGGGLQVLAPTVLNTYGLLVFDNSVGGGNGALKARSTSSPRIATFDTTQGSGGYIAIERNGSDGGFFGNSAILTITGFLDAYCLRSNGGLDFAAGGQNIRMRINSTGNVTCPIPDSGISFAVDQGTLDSSTNPGIQTKGNSGNGARISICGNGASPSVNSLDVVQVGNGDCYIINRANTGFAFWNNNTPWLVVSTTSNNALFTNAISVNGATPPLQVTGWGTPVGSAVINNYNITDAGGANSNTNKAVAQIIKDLKALGFYGT